MPLAHSPRLLNHLTKTSRLDSDLIESPKVIPNELILPHFTFDAPISNSQGQILFL